MLPTDWRIFWQFRFRTEADEYRKSRSFCKRVTCWGESSLPERGTGRPPLIRFPGEHEIHRGENAETAGFGKGGAADIQHCRDMGGAARHDPQLFE